MNHPFTYGLHKLTDYCYAFIQPNGSWGLNNCGLIVHENKGILIDTLYDLKLTQKMLETIYMEFGSDFRIEKLINTHANGDHWYGNSLVDCEQIISTEKTLTEMKDMPPSKMALFNNVSWLLGGAGKYFRKNFSKFNFKGITPEFPNKTFNSSMEFTLGTVKVSLEEFNNAHTVSDIIVTVADEKVLFTGDLLFADCTPPTWSYPLKSWINACDKILDMDIDIIVPGHGPITDKASLKHQKEYFLFLYEQVCPRFEKGMSPLETALDIDLGEYKKWGESERIVFNIYSIYRELDPSMKEISAIGMFKMVEAYVRMS